MRCTSPLVFAVVVLMSSAVGSAAQAPPGAIVGGQVVDSITGDPIQGVLIRMDVGAETFTDARGRFRFTGLPQGRRLFAILTADCRIAWSEIFAIEGIPRETKLRLPQAFGAVAEAEKREDAQRRRTGGKRMEAEEIDRTHSRSVTELIGRLAPGMVRMGSGEVGANPVITSGRSRSFLTDDAPVLVVDGVRMPFADRVLADMDPSEVAVLEVLPGSVAGWEFGSAGAGGVIRITLRKGLATGASSSRSVTDCVVPDFPRE